MGSKAERLCSIDYPIDYSTDRIRNALADTAMSADEAAEAMSELRACVERVCRSLPNAMEMLRDS